MSKKLAVVNYMYKFFYKMLLWLSNCCAAASVASDRDCVA